MIQGIVELLVAGTGFVIIGMTASWGVAIGVFVLLWGNNIGHSRRLL